MTSEGVVNAASFGPGISPGSLATIFGRGLTSFNGIVQATSFPIPNELARTSVTLAGERVPVLAVAYVEGVEQINFQVPFSFAGRERVPLQVSANGGVSNLVEVPLTPRNRRSSPSLDPAMSLRSGRPASARSADLPPPGRLRPVDPPSRVTGNTQVTVGGADAAVDYSGLAPAFAGLYQINATLHPALRRTPRSSCGSAARSASRILVSRPDEV